MKISIIHNVYKRNPHINESVRYNIEALKKSNVDYQYIIFNDKGDKEIYEDTKDILDPNLEYYYSEHNFGMGVCSGGWVGAIPIINGDIIHNTGQDDVFVTDFYNKAIEVFSYPEIMFFSCNGIRTDENLNQQGPMIPPQFHPDYSKPLDRFKEWFGVVNNKVTKANNNLLAPGTLYRKELHKIIGEPNLEKFKGAADMEYWARILLNEQKGYYHPSPLWLYRESQYSTSQSPEYNDLNQLLIKEFKSLWEKRS
jgi:hypothetical protein|tara:strand:- start:1330 stop:2091 length:762 start_codon:yes stop_codon:yes gene_type:complete